MFSRLNFTIGIALKKPISKNRKQILQNIINYIQEKLASNKVPLINFICTHNSRRSQFAQIWAQTAAAYFNIDSKCYSGGVEVTAFNQLTVASVKRNGFKVEIDDEEKANPKHLVFYSKYSKPIITFSKLFDDKVNPSELFIAILTCSDADENCPFIPSSEKRISLKYEDPKTFDGTSDEEEKYNERSLQIASEMLYVFQKIKD